MDNFWTLLVLVGAGLLIWQVMKGGRWNRETGRWERYHPDNPYVRRGMEPPAANGALDRAEIEAELARLKARLDVLERIAEPDRPTARRDEPLP